MIEILIAIYIGVYIVMTIWSMGVVKREHSTSRECHRQEGKQVREHGTFLYERYSRSNKWRDEIEERLFALENPIKLEIKRGKWRAKK